MTMKTIGVMAAASVISLLSVGMSLAQTLDFETYKARVEPIFLRHRAGHARCIVCHEANNSAFRLQPLKEGSTGWTEEQSRMNYQNVIHLVKPGDPNGSKLLIHPLAKDGGGDEFHGGGRQFKTKDDPDWKTIADWVNSAK